MLLESITLENFRQFRHESIDFAQGENGKNVTVKFTISENNIDYKIYAKNEEGNAYSNVKIKLYNNICAFFVQKAKTMKKNVFWCVTPEANRVFCLRLPPPL